MTEPAAQTLDAKRRRLSLGARGGLPYGMANRAWAARLREFSDTFIAPAR
jgi:hypothetical protein